MLQDLYDVPAALGTVVEAGRGRLPFVLLHGESLVASAAWALGEAGVTLVDASVTWAGIQEAEEPFVLHDALCPLTPPAFLATCVRRTLAADAIAVGVRPVTDTVKRLDGQLLADTVDRETVWTVASPIVLPARVVAALDAMPTGDFATLVDEWSRTDWGPVLLVEAPPEGRRVHDPDDVRLLAALTTPERL